MQHSGPSDYGSHTVGAIVTEEFLNFSRERGNDLITPRPEYNFPGLKPGCKWCLCAARFKEALMASERMGQDNLVPKVILEATHREALKVVSLEQFRRYAVNSGSFGVRGNSL